MTPFLLTILAYIAGATPTSYWVGRGLHGVDLREKGSGNLGATNVFRVLGAKAALPVVLVDVGKGWVPVALFPLLHGEAAMEWVFAYAGAAILGHVFSFWVGFKGGKGVATSAGALLGLAPWAVLIGFAVFVAAVAATRYVSLGSLLAAVTLPAALLVTPHRGGPMLVYFALALAAFVIWAHRANVGRLIRGEENRLGQGPGVEG